MLNKVIIIFSGFNQRAIIAFLRTLEANKLQYAIIAKSNTDSIFLTNYKDKVITVRKSVPLVLDDLLKSITVVKNKINANEYIIAPTAEALNRFLLKNETDFIKLGCVIPLVSKKLYELISDKRSFGELCSQNNIFIPNEFSSHKVITYPCVAKPNKYFSSTTGKILSPLIIKNSFDFDKFVKKYFVEDFYLQEYILGESYYLLYYFHRNSNVYRFSQKNIVQQHEGKSIIAATSSAFHCSNESEKYEKLLKSLNFFGLVMIEVKKRVDKTYMIEANPRFWGPSQLFVDAGMNFFEAFLHDFGVSKKLPLFLKPTKEFKYFWFGGIMETFKQKHKLTYHQSNEFNLMCKLPLWLQSDIYRRKDTLGVFKNELI